MEQRQLGRTDLRLSRIGLGCGNFGGIGSAPEHFGGGETEAEAFRLMDEAWDLGITFFDTADAYGGGRSEQAIGRWLKTKNADVRDRLVISSKVFHSDVGDPRDRGLSHDRILRQIDRSLERLGVERLDMYLIHEPDPDTPLEETLGALDELVRAGKVRWIGASNIEGWRLRESLELSGAGGLARFEWVQNEYSLLAREAEEDVLPVCGEHELGFTPFSPLAGGWLTGKYRAGQPFPAGSRMTLRPGPYQTLVHDRTFSALEELGGAAAERGVDMATLALAWVLTHPQFPAVVIAPRRPQHLDPVTPALELDLTDDERANLAAVFA